jgi:hypothetical protein
MFATMNVKISFTRLKIARTSIVALEALMTVNIPCHVEQPACMLLEEGKY